MKRKFIYLLLIMFSITSVKAYATNATGTSYDEEKSLTTGENTPTVTITEITDITSTSATVKATITGGYPYVIHYRNVCLSTDGTVFNCTTYGSGYGDFEVEITNLSPGTKYYVKALAYYYDKNNYENGGEIYDVKEFYTTSTIQPPTVITSTKIFEHGTNSVISGGEVTNTGGAEIIARGVCWGTSENPVIDNNDNKTTDGTGTGSFTSTIINLEPGTTYYVRAYATNSQGTGYGNVITFTKKNVFTQNYTSAGEVATNNEDKAYSLIFSYPNTNRSQDCTLLGFHSVTNLTNPETTLDHLIIPNTVTISSKTEYKVTAIDDEAFYSAVAINSDMSSFLRNIRNVTIPENVTSIGKNAFNGVGSAHIYSPGTLVVKGGGNVSFGDNAFNGTIFTKMFLSTETPPTVSSRDDLPQPYEDGNPQNLLVFVPQNVINEYNNWSSSWSYITIHQNISDHPYWISSNSQTYTLTLNYNANYSGLKIKLGTTTPSGHCSLIIPATVNIDGVEYNITQIEEDAFSNTEACANFKSVICHRITAPAIANSSFSGFTTSVPLYVGGQFANDGSQGISDTYNTWRAITIGRNKLFSSIHPASVKKTYNDYSLDYTITYGTGNTNNNQCAISSITTETNPSLHIVESVDIPNNTTNPPTYLTCNVTAIKDGVFNGKNFNSITVYAENVALGDNAVTIASGGFIYIPEMYRTNYETSWLGNKKYMPCLVNEGTNEDVGIWDKEGDITSADKIVVKGQCILPAGTTTCDTYYLLKDASLKLDVDNAQLVLNSNGNRPITVEKTIEGYGSTAKSQSSTKWYTISSPLEGNVNITDITNLIDATTPKNYDLYRYDEEDYKWENYKKSSSNNFTSLEPGRGYLYANANEVTLSFTGEVNTENVTYNLTASGSHLTGFHLVGNPFTHNITFAKLSTNAGTLANGYYMLNGEGGWAAEPSTGEIKPGQGILIKTTDAGTLTISHNTTAKGHQPRANSQQPMISLNVSNGNYSDRAFVIFGEGVGLDKINHENKDIPLLYIPMSDADYAIAMMDESVNEIPVSFETNNMGEFTISLKHENCEFEELYLLDKETGSKVNILEQDYTFMATSGDNPDRFVLVKDKGQQTTDNSHFAYINNGDVVIYGAEGNAHIDIYDVLGRRVYNNNGSDDVHIVSTDGYSAGVYVIRLMDENGLRTQKVVIE